MTPSIINETNKEPDRMSSTRSSSLPENMLNIRSSSLSKNSPDIQSTSLSSNLPDTPLPSNFPNKRSASLPSLNSFEERIKNDDENINSSKISRRFATYDLNWNSTDDHIDLENSIQSITLSDPIILPSSTKEEFSPSSPPIISSPISPISPISNNDYYNYFNFDNEENYSFPGGITVTTVKVVQVDKRLSIERASRIPLPKNKVLYKNESNNTYNILKKQLTIKRQKKSTTNNNNNNNNNNISKQTIKERRKTKIYNNIEQKDIAQLKMINNINERKFNGVVRRTSSRRRLGGVHYRKSYKKRQIQSQERMVPAPTSNPLYTNDPTDMEGDDVILSPITKGFPWLPVTNGPPKLLHASLVPLSQFIKNIETTPTVDVSHSKSKRKSVESMSAPKPKRPSQLFRQNLLEQSVALSFNEAAMKSFASQSNQISKSTKSVQSINKPKRKTIESISAPKPKRPSQLFRENLLEQSVAMSFNETLMGRNVLATQPTQSTQSTQSRRSTKKLDRGHIESISEPEPKRPSQLFRENLLEQSVAMSLDETLMGRNVFATERQSLNTKIPRRRFSRRGSNAKFRKEKSEKNKKGKNKKDDNDQKEQIIKDTVNPMVISSILGDDELKTKVEEQLRKRAVLQSPQPPPRHFTPSTTESQRGVIVRRRSKSAKLEKRLIKTEPLSRKESRERRDSIQLYPNHLAKRNKSLHWR